MSWRRVDVPLGPLPQIQAAGGSRVPADSARARAQGDWSRYMGLAGDLGPRDHSRRTAPDAAVTVDPATAPRCDAYVVALGDLCVSLQPLGITVRRRMSPTIGPISWAPEPGDIEWLVSALRHWPSLGHVLVTDTGDWTHTLLSVLAAEGFSAVSVVATLDIKVEQEKGEGSEEPYWWLWWGSGLPWAFGSFYFDDDDVAAVLGWLRRVRATEVPITADRARLAVLGAAFDTAGLRWRPNGNLLPEVISSGDVTSGGLTLRLDLQRHGWMRVHIGIVDHTFDHLATNVINQGWDELVRAVRLAAVDDRPSSFDLDDEPGVLRGILIPAAGTGLATVEWWDNPTGRSSPRGGHPERFLGAWTGRMHDLAIVTARATRAVIDTIGVDAVRDRWGPPPLADLVALEASLA